MWLETSREGRPVIWAAKYPIAKGSASKLTKRINRLRSSARNPVVLKFVDDS
jgi:hypothetical protein